MNRDLTQINIKNLKESINGYKETIKDIKTESKKKIKLLELAIKDKEKEIEYNKKVTSL